VWTFTTVPQPGETGHENLGRDSWRDRTGVNVLVGAERGRRTCLLFLPIGSAAYDFMARTVKVRTCLPIGLVALGAATGKLVWYTRCCITTSGITICRAACAINVRRNAGNPAVAPSYEDGFRIYPRRLTGKPLFPGRRKTGPKSDVPGESAWPTNRFPVATALARHL